MLCGICSHFYDELVEQENRKLFLGIGILLGSLYWNLDYLHRGDFTEVFVLSEYFLYSNTVL